MQHQKIIYDNWGIYECDILHLGGTVCYTGIIEVEKKRYRIEEAVLQIGDTSCHAYMKRFADGSAVICAFVRNGLISTDNVSPEAADFLEAFYNIADKDDRFLSFSYMRKFKQAITGILQGLSVLCFVYAVFSLLHSGFNVFPLILLILAPVLFCILCTFYKWYRLETPDKHKFFLLEEDNENKHL